MAKKKTGLGVDALFPEKEEGKDLSSEREEEHTAEATKTEKRRASGQTRQQRREVPRDERIKTSVELTPETLELIDQIKAQYRREHHRHLPMWRILDEAVRELAQKGL